MIEWVTSWERLAAVVQPRESTDVDDKQDSRKALNVVVDKE